MYPRSGTGDQLHHGHVAGPGRTQGTLSDVVQKLNESFKKAMDDPEFQQKAKDMSVILSYLGRKTSVRSWSGTMNFSGS
jgi:tryptophan synthase beta subunit